MTGPSGDGSKRQRHKNADKLSINASSKTGAILADEDGQSVAAALPMQPSYPAKSTDLM